MLKHEYLFTPGELHAADDIVVSDIGVVIAHCNARHLKSVDERIYERKCNARLFAESKKMLELTEEIALMAESPRFYGTTLPRLRGEAIEIIARIKKCAPEELESK